MNTIGIKKSFAITAVALFFAAAFATSAYAAITLLTVTAPNGAEEWRGTQTITWTSNGTVGDFVNIVYSDNDFAGQSIIATNVPNTGSYDWDTTTSVFADPGSLYKVRFLDGSNLVFDSSDVAFTIDNEDPVTTETASPLSPNGDNGWYISAPSITLVCADGVGSGCDTTYYDWDNATPASVYAGALTPAEGEHTLYYYSEDQAVDNAGAHNQETIQSTTYKVDTAAPTVAVTSTTADGYYNEPDAINVTLTFSEAVWSTDALTITFDSGGTCSVSTLTNATEGTCTYTVGAGEDSMDLNVVSIVPDSGVVEDIAGNPSTLIPTANLAGSSDINVDTTSPAAFTAGNVTPSGGTVVPTWWNASNTGVDVLIPIANDISLTNGTVQLQAEADGTYENVGPAATIVGGDLGTTISLSLTEAQLEGLVGFGEIDILQFRAVITDRAGNSTTGTESATSLTVDQIIPTVDAGTSKESNLATISQSGSIGASPSGSDSPLWTKQSGPGTITFGNATMINTTITADTAGTYVIRVTGTDNAGNTAYDEMTFIYDLTPPVITDVTPVPPLSNNTTPSYTFEVDTVGYLTGHSGGGITYGGSCTSATPATASDGNNTITYAAMTDGTYADCTLVVTDAAGNASAPFTVPSFTIDTAVATIVSKTAKDTDNNGSIDTVTVVYDDVLDDDMFAPSDFSIGATTATAIDTGTTPDDNTLNVLFGTEIEGTGAVTLTYAGTGTDLAGNAVATYTNAATIDAAQPVLMSARTVTTTQVDARFSEDLDGNTLNISGNEFAVVGYTVSAATESAPGIVTLTVDTMSTGATPDVTYTQFGAGPVYLDDPTGNSAISPTTVAAIDEVAPTLSGVSIESDNTTPTLAKEGDEITLNFTASETISTPTVTIQGQVATVTDKGGNAWSATYTMSGADIEGNVTFTIDFADVAVPTPNNGVQVVTVNDATSVLFDRTAPSVDAGTDKEVNAVVSQDATTSDIGSGIDTWSWTKESGAGTVLFSAPTAEDTDISADTDGSYTLRLTVEDEAGNSAYDEMTFIWDSTNPEPITSAPTNGLSGVSKADGTATVTFDEPVVLLDGTRVLFVNDATATSHKGAVAVDGGDATVLNIPYTGLAFGTKYRINVKPNALEDIAGNNLFTNFISYFTTEIDTIAPVVNAFSAGSITTTSATLSVTTDENATCAYATSDSDYATMTAFATTGTTAHSQALAGLADSTEFNYYARCADTTSQTNTMTTSAHVSFTTLVPDTTGPVVSNIQATSISETEATITWGTDENATSRVEYGTTSTYGSFSALDATADNTTHSVALSGLTDGITYHFRVVSKDATGNETTSGDNTFTTNVTADTTAPDTPSITTSSTTIDADTYTVAGTVANDGATRIVTLYNGATEVATIAVPAGSTSWATLTALTQDTANVFTATATDEVGNVSGVSASVTITEAEATGDTDAPAVPVITTADDTVDADTYTIAGTAGADTPTDGARTITIYRNGDVVGSLVLPTGDTSWSFVAPLAQDATNAFTSYSTDASGNTSAVSNTTTITEATVADTTAPDVPAFATTATTVDADTFTLEGTVANDGAVRLVRIFNNGTLVETTSVPNGQTTWSVLVALNQDTTNEFTATAVDAANNESAASASVTITEATVTDTTAPTITLLGQNPMTLTVGDTFTDPGATASDNVDGNISGSIVVAGDTVNTAAAGTYTITYNVSDTATNPATQETRTVIVVDPAVTPVTPTVTLNGVAIVSSYTATDAATRFASGLQFDTTNAASVTVNGSSVTAGATITAATLGEATTLGLHVYNVVVTSSTGETANITVSYEVVADFDDTASLAVTGIDAVKTYATADDTYTNGWSWTYHITVPTSETQFQMKFSDFVSGANTIPAAANIRYYTPQASANADDANAITISAANTYGTVITLDADLESGTAGRQIEVTVEMKVPVGSAGGSYSGSYGVFSDTI